MRKTLIFLALELFAEFAKMLIDVFRRRREMGKVELMAGKVTNAGERKLLDTALQNVGVLTVKLAKAAFDPVDGLEPADFTEADYIGYAGQELTYTGLAAGNPGGKAVGQYTELVFEVATTGGANDAYGYWVEDELGVVVACERFPGSPKPMRIAGQVVHVPFSLRMFSPV